MCSLMSSRDLSTVSRLVYSTWNFCTHEVFCSINHPLSFLCSISWFCTLILKLTFVYWPVCFLAIRIFSWFVPFGFHLFVLRLWHLFSIEIHSLCLPLNLSYLLNVCTVDSSIWRISDVVSLWQFLQVLVIHNILHVPCLWFISCSYNDSTFVIDAKFAFDL